MMQTAISPLARNRVLLVLIIALFVLPLAAAWLLVGQWRPTGTTNHGELLNPAEPLVYLKLSRPEGGEIDESYLRGHWTLIYVGSISEGCDRRCRESLYDLRQVRLALGKDMLRAQTLFIMADEPAASALAWLRREHQAMTAGVADARTLAIFRQAFPGGGSAGDWLFLTDPLGNLFMRYQVGSNPKGMLDDLRHLLKLSKIG